MMPALRIPPWLPSHLMLSSSEAECAALRRRMTIFQVDQPEVSLVMPAYNEAAYILKALSSLASLHLAQSLPCELIVVDDASTDATPKLLASLGIKHLRLTTNLRPKGARQAGLEAASGTYLLQVDADTLYPPDWGLRYVKALEDPNISVAYGSHAFVPGPGKTRWPYVLHEGLGTQLYSLRRRHRPYLNVHGFNSAFRRTDALQHGSYEHSPQGSEDGHMALMLSRIGRLQYFSQRDCRAWTSDRRLQADGGLGKAFVHRVRKEGARLWEYLKG